MSFGTFRNVWKTEGLDHSRGEVDLTIQMGSGQTGSHPEEVHTCENPSLWSLVQYKKEQKRNFTALASILISVYDTLLSF